MGEIQRCRRFAVYGSAVRPWKTLTDEEKLNVEISENEVRKDFSKAERVEYGRRLERIEREKAKERQGTRTDISPMLAESAETREKVAEQLGVKRETLRKETVIVDNKNLLDPSEFADWDEGKLSTNKAFQKDTTPQKAPPEPGHRRGSRSK